jgi:hypothetical protein
LQQESHAIVHPYNHVHAQPKAVVPCNRSHTLHQAAPVQTRTRANQSRGLKQESHASPSRTRTTTYTRNPKPWSLAIGVARITKPHPYKHVHAQPKGRGPFNRSRTHHQAVEARKAIAFNFLKVEGRCGVVTTRNYLFKNYVFLNSNNYVNFILARICMQV